MGPPILHLKFQDDRFLILEKKTLKVFSAIYGYGCYLDYVIWSIYYENIPIQVYWKLYHQKTEKGLLHSIGNLHWFLPTLGI